ncbi:MAG: bifunctional nuclease family protein [Chloroflexi bacterium]|nr:bifunctional nuclease family protein [Chloroflexota bacterium]
MIELNVYAVLYSLLSRHRIVLLKEVLGERYLPVWIGQNESEAIAMRLQGAVVPRPLTHDLLASVIAELGGDVQYVLINDLQNSIFYARLAIQHDGTLQMIDSRPSDAIALAVRVDAPIYVAEEVLDKAGITPSPDIRHGDGGEDDLDVFRDFVDNLDLGDLEN